MSMLGIINILQAQKISGVDINNFFDSILPVIGAALSGRINDYFQKFYPAS